VAAAGRRPGPARAASDRSASARTAPDRSASARATPQHTASAPDRGTRPRTASARAARPNPPGAHALVDHLAARLVRQSPVTPDDLVMDLGAGDGALTVPLARTGARVIAVERDERTARRLTGRLSGYGNVTVVVGDALTVPLPHRPYLVVANIPFGVTTALLRRLLDSPLAAADLVVEGGAARLLTASRPGRAELLRWQATFRLTRGAVLPATSFRPPPSVDAVVLRVRRRPQPPPAGLATLLRHAYRGTPSAIGSVVGRAAARRAGIDPRLPVAALTADDWLVLAGDRPAAKAPRTRRYGPGRR
jgi:23S rRNA (adenine-N6)-dimethyltransferase